MAVGLGSGWPTPDLPLSAEAVGEWSHGEDSTSPRGSAAVQLIGGSDDAGRIVIALTAFTLAGRTVS
jgi:hypothetical protein